MLFWKHKEWGKRSCLLHIRDSAQLQTVLALYEQENIRNTKQPSYSRLKTSVTRHVDQTVRTPNFKARNERIGTGVVAKSQRGTKVIVDRKVGECSHWKANLQSSRGDSCSSSHGSNRGKKYKRALLFQLRSHRLKKEPSKGFGPTGESVSGRKGRKPCKKNPQMKVHGPVVWLLAPSRMSKLHVWDRMHIWQWLLFPTFWSGGKAQQEVKERWCERSSCLTEGVFSIGLCCSRFSSKKVCSTWGKLGSNHPVKIPPRARGTRKGSSQGFLQNVRTSRMQSVCSQTWGKDTRRNFATRKMRPQSGMGLGVKCLQAQKIRTKLRCMSNAGTFFEKSQRSENSRLIPPGFLRLW